MRTAKLQAMRANRERAATRQLLERREELRRHLFEAMREHDEVRGRRPQEYEATSFDKPVVLMATPVAERRHPLLCGALGFLLDQLRALWRYLSRKTQ